MTMHNMRIEKNMHVASNYLEYVSHREFHFGNLTIFVRSFFFKLVITHNIRSTNINFLKMLFKCMIVIIVWFNKAKILKEKRRKSGFFFCF